MFGCENQTPVLCGRNFLSTARDNCRLFCKLVIASRCFVNGTMECCMQCGINLLWFASFLFVGALLLMTPCVIVPSRHTVTLGHAAKDPVLDELCVGF